MIYLKYFDLKYLLLAGPENSCKAKEGNPFGPFWDTFNIDFVGSEFYGPLHYDTYHQEMAKQWHDKYPADSWPILAFTGNDFECIFLHCIVSI